MNQNNQATNKMASDSNNKKLQDALVITLVCLSIVLMLTPEFCSSISLRRKYYRLDQLSQRQLIKVNDTPTPQENITSVTNALSISPKIEDPLSVISKTNNETNNTSNSNSLDQLHNLNETSTITTTKKPNQEDANKKPEDSIKDQIKRQQLGENEYLVGLGLADITGPAADVNLVSLLIQLISQLGAIPASVSGGSSAKRQSGSSGPQATQPLTSNVNNFKLFNDLLVVEHPSWQEMTNIKLRFRINLRNSFILNLIQNQSPVIYRWAMPNQIKLQAEYTYANLVVQL